MKLLFKVYFSWFSLFLFIFSSLSVRSQELNLRDIMRGYDYIGHPPENAQWSVGRDTLYYFKKDSSLGPSVLYGFDIKSQKSDRLDLINSNRIVLSPERQFVIPKSNERLAVTQGNLLKIHANNNISVLLDLPSNIEFSGFGKNDSCAYLIINNDFYRYHLHNGSLLRLNEMIRQKDPSKQNAEKSWMQKEELSLFDFHHENARTRELREQQKKGVFDLPKFYLDKRECRPLAISGDGRFVAYSIYLNKENKSTQIPNYMAEDGYSTMIQGRPKVGQELPEHRLWVGDLQLDTFVSIDLSDLPGIYNKPEYLKEYTNDVKTYSQKYDQPKSLSITQAWSSHEHDSWLIEIISHDNKDRWLILFHPESREWALVDHQHDEAWIGGPGIRYSSKSAGFIPGTPWVYFKSENTGFAHLYLYNITTKNKRALTSGDFEIHDVIWSLSKKQFFVKANPVDPGVYSIYELFLDGSMNLISPLEGASDLITDVYGSNMALLHSKANVIPEIYLQTDTGWQQITHSISDSFKSHPWQAPDVVYFAASDGVQVPARIYRPSVEKQNGSAVLFVHGAGYLQNAHKFWSTYYREYMFHHLLMDMGYTVMDVDFRASAGYGRDWRTAIYRHMGGRDLDDYVDARKYLIDSCSVQPDKIGIYGGSYGGFITMMALFKYPGLFACGAALRSVTDWAHYNHGYTSNILNTPFDDSISYKRSSPIYFAEGLNDPLLILHGVLDVNVQFQDVIRLNQKLIELEKKSFQMALYPIEDHGFSRHSSWYDEYSRILNWFENYLR
jgi:dipeptidyl aminopeptidase/acylaminoacyl peptidase